ncbi:hypothetical protein HDU97_002805 [Phlyctochytrium planicorne]|nr:hypothetical protein HDU97_002805 [Phlyctochytrium planicorne]
MRSCISSGKPYVERGSAAVAMIDIAGYSNLTSKLADLGKISSELVSKAVSDFMAKLIDAAILWGGDVVKFLGDAIIVVFHQDENITVQSVIERAILCCLTILKNTPHLDFDASDLIPAVNFRNPAISVDSEKARMRSKTTTSLTETKLELHMAVVAGEVENVIVGSLSSRLDYIVSGACIHAIGNLLNEATKGDIGIHEDVWRLFAEDNSLNGVDFDKALRRTSAGTIVNQSAASIILERSQSKFKSKFGGILGTSGAQSLKSGFNINMIKCFVNASVVASIKAMNPENFTDTNQPLEINTTVAVKSQFRYISIIFVKLLSDFSPQLAQEAMQKFNEALIKYGGVFQQFAGDVVNRAARMLGVGSEEFPIVCDAETISLVNGFKCGMLGRFQLKGMENLAEIWHVDSIDLESGNSKEHQVNRVFGYVIEREMLQSELSLWRNQLKNPVVVLEGPSGVGKSTLQTFFVNECTLAGMSICITRVPRESAMMPFSGLRQVVQCIIRSEVFQRQSFTVLEKRHSLSSFFLDQGDRDLCTAALKAILKALDENPDEYPLFAPLFPSIPFTETDLTRGMSANPRRQRLVMICVKLILASIKRLSLVMIFDDIQWMDSMSMQVLVQMCSFCTSVAEFGQIFILICTRPRQEFESERLLEILSLNGVIHAALHGFREEDVKDFLLGTFRDDSIISVDPKVLKVLFEKAANSPLVMQTIVDIFRKKDCFMEMAGTLYFKDESLAFVTSVLEQSVNHSIMMQFDRLHPKYQDLLRHSSIFGQYFSLQSVLDVTPNGEKMDIHKLEEFIAEEDQFSFLQIADITAGYPPHSYFFRHISIVNAIYESLPFSDKAVLHETVAKMVESELTETNRVLLLPSLHFHFWETAVIDKKILYAEEFGLYCLDAGLTTEAISVLSKLIEFTDHPLKVPPGILNNVRRAHWFSALTESAALLLQIDVVMERALKTLQLLDVPFPKPDSCTTGYLLRRVFKLIGILIATRVGKAGIKKMKPVLTKPQSYRAQKHVYLHRALHSFLVAATASTSDKINMQAKFLILVELLIYSCAIRLEEPAPWIECSITIAFFLLAVAPNLSRMFFNSTLLAIQKSEFSKWERCAPIYIPLLSAMGFDVQAIGKEITEFKTFFQRTGQAANIQMMRMNELYIQCADSFEKLESELMRIYDQVDKDQAHVAQSTLMRMINWSIICGLDDKLSFYYEKYDLHTTKLLKQFNGDRPFYLSLCEHCIKTWKAVRAGNVREALAFLKPISAYVTGIRVSSPYQEIIMTSFLAVWPMLSLLLSTQTIQDTAEDMNTLSQVLENYKPFVVAFAKGIADYRPFGDLFWGAFWVVKNKKSRAFKKVLQMMKDEGRLSASIPHYVAIGNTALFVLSGDENYRSKAATLCLRYGMNGILEWVNSARSF